MNQELVRARKDLYTKREVERNLPCYLSGLAGVYYRMASYNLAMQYTSFTEGVAEGDLVLSAKAKEYADILKGLIDGLATDGAGADAESGLQTVIALRKELNMRWHV